VSDQEKQLKKRFEELAARAADRQYYTYTEFLTPADQSLLLQLRLPSPCTLLGGYSMAERRMACFGDNRLLGYEPTPPIVCLRIAPTAPKFAQKLTHRDFLGALMGLGMRREVMGDILLQDNEAYLFCMDTIASYLTDQLTQVSRTNVTVTQVDAPPAAAVELPPTVYVVITSERLDALVAAVYKLSRAESQRLFAAGKVFVGGRATEYVADAPKEGDIISVRGTGRFVYEGVSAETKKGRLRAAVRIFK